MNKFENFPPVYCVSLSDSFDRRNYMKGQLDALGVYDVTYVECYDGRTVDFRETGLVTGDHIDMVSPGAIATTISHIKAIKYWLDNSDSQYAIICEDDMIFYTSNFWNFTWNDFMKILPENWECIQLSLIRENFNFNHSDFVIKQKSGFDWSAGCYLLNRKSGMDIINDYVLSDGRYDLTVKKQRTCMPDPESIIYGPSFHNYKIYVFPMFVENVIFSSTFYPYFIETKIKNSQYESSINVYEWWKQNGSTFNLK